jgi:Protein of unknown function (DUF1569)
MTQEQNRMTLNTRKVRDRRPLHFNCYGCLRSDVAKLSEAGCEPLGNWTLGQACWHLAAGIDRSIDGFDFKAPLPLRLIGALLKKRFLAKTFGPGIRLTGDAAKALTPPDIGDREGVELLFKAIDRVKTEQPRHPSPVLGSLTVQQWEQCHCRHAELHLGFFRPVEPAG